MSQMAKRIAEGDNANTVKSEASERRYPKLSTADMKRLGEVFRKTLPDLQIPKSASPPRRQSQNPKQHQPN